MREADLGTARVTPARNFPVGHTGTWKIVYEVGRFGIDDGGSILIVQRDMTDAVPLQCENPRRPGYVSVSTTGKARLRARYDASRWIRPWRGAVVIGVKDGSLSPGERIEVTLGDRSAGSKGWTLQTFPETSHQFKVLVDPFGAGEYREIADHPSIRIVPGRPAVLEAILPSVAFPGEEVPLWVRVLDRWENPVSGFRGEVSLKCRGETKGLPPVFSVKGGVQRVANISFPRAGTYRLQLSSGRLRGRSNPICVSEDLQPIFWADIHGQTEDTIGTGTLEEYFRFARDKALLDVVSWQGNDFQVTDEIWKEVSRKTKEFNEPGRLVTFLGYEWSGLTPAGGDHNVLYLEDDQPIFRSSRWQVTRSTDPTDYYPITKLWRALGHGEKTMAVAHVGGRSANLDLWNPEFCHLVEIHSVHGTFEWIAREAIERGLLTGFAAGSDDHSGRPGLSAPMRRPGLRGAIRFDVHGGLTGIYAPALTRKGVWNALKSRHCYATTGPRLLLEVRSGEFMMGDVVEAKEIPELSVTVVGTAPILDLEVLRDLETIYRCPLKGGDDDGWVRLDWSGVMTKTRDRRADWSGVIEVEGGRIEKAVPFGFKRKGENIRRISESALRVRSTTSGDMLGIFLKVSGENPSLRFDTKPLRRSVELDRITRTPKVFAAGGIDLKLRVQLSDPHNRPERAQFTFRDKSPEKGRHAYWIKVVQEDGHMAWSSPIYVEV